MANGSSDLVRFIARQNYVHPALSSGKKRFSLAVRDLMRDLQGTGFPSTNYPQICTAIRTGKFLRENGLEIDSIDGPPSGLSTTVVVHYRVADSASEPPASRVLPAALSGNAPPAAESAANRAVRIAESLRGLLKTELEEYGGGEEFIRWVRSESEPAVPLPSHSRETPR